MLSKRQAEILQRVKDAKSDKAIACELGISIHTVRTHIERIAAKFPGEVPRRYRLFFLEVESDPT
jgi:DNA-binding CsgD family transcriptional regulator